MGSGSSVPTDNCFPLVRTTPSLESTYEECFNHLHTHTGNPRMKLKDFNCKLAIDTSMGFNGTPKPSFCNHEDFDAVVSNVQEVLVGFREKRCHKQQEVDYNPYSSSAPKRIRQTRAQLAQARYRSFELRSVSLDDEDQQVRNYKKLEPKSCPRVKIRNRAKDIVKTVENMKLSLKQLGVLRDTAHSFDFLGSPERAYTKQFERIFGNSSEQRPSISKACRVYAGPSSSIAHSRQNPKQCLISPGNHEEMYGNHHHPPLAQKKLFRSPPQQSKTMHKAMDFDTANGTNEDRDYDHNDRNCYGLHHEIGLSFTT